MWPVKFFLILLIIFFDIGFVTIPATLFSLANFTAMSMDSNIFLEFSLLGVPRYVFFAIFEWQERFQISGQSDRPKRIQKTNDQN